jgi:DNA-binding HxlR family transcriptional regulator
MRFAEIPRKYDYLELLNIKQQITILELFSNKSLRTKKIYKLGLYKSFNDLSYNLNKLIKKKIIKRVEKNPRNITYELTSKGLNLAYILAENEIRFKTYIDDFIIIVNIGKRKPDLLKKYVEYRIENNGFS